MRLFLIRGLACKEVRTLKTKRDRKKAAETQMWLWQVQKPKINLPNRTGNGRWALDHWERRANPEFPVWARKLKDNTALGGDPGKLSKPESGLTHSRFRGWMDYYRRCATTRMPWREDLVPGSIFSESPGSQPSEVSRLPPPWSLPWAFLSTACKQRSPAEYSLSPLKPQPRTSLWVVYIRYLSPW